MQIGVTLIPSGDWRATLNAAKAADAAGLDAIGVWDHFHSNNPDEALIGGWTLYGALAMATRRIELVPMVLNQMSYPINVLAKETASLAIICGGRFELGIGLGGWRAEHVLWGQPFPDAATRTRMLEEKVTALQQLWTGEPVTFQGEYVHFDGATARPAPPVPPRVVVGGASTVLIESALRYADEINIVGLDRDNGQRLRLLQSRIKEGERNIAISAGRFWMEWPANAGDQLRRLADQGIDRVFINLPHPYDTIRRLGELVADELG